MAHISLFFYFTLSRAFTLTGRVGGEDMTTVNDKLSPYYSSASPFYLFFFLLFSSSSSAHRPSSDDDGGGGIERGISRPTDCPPFILLFSLKMILH